MKKKWSAMKGMKHTLNVKINITQHVPKKKKKKKDASYKRTSGYTSRFQTHRDFVKGCFVSPLQQRLRFCRVTDNGNHWYRKIVSKFKRDIYIKTLIDRPKLVIKIRIWINMALCESWFLCGIDEYFIIIFLRNFKKIATIYKIILKNCHNFKKFKN